MAELETWVDMLDQLDLRRTDCAYDVRQVVDDIRLGEWETARRRAKCLHHIAKVWDWERLSGVSSLLLATIAVHDRDLHTAGHRLDDALYSHVRLYEGADLVNQGLMWLAWATVGILRGFKHDSIYQRVRYAMVNCGAARDVFARGGDEEGFQHAIYLMKCLERLLPDRWQLPLTLEGREG